MLIRFLAAALAVTSCFASVGCCDLGVEEDCECDKTAKLALGNQSASTYNVILDGVQIGTIEPGGFIQRTVSEGQHSIEYRFASDDAVACTKAFPDIRKCEDQEFFCAAN